MGAPSLAFVLDRADLWSRQTLVVGHGLIIEKTISTISFLYTFALLDSFRIEASYWIVLKNGFVCFVL